MKESFMIKLNAQMLINYSFVFSLIFNLSFQNSLPWLIPPENYLVQHLSIIHPRTYLDLSMPGDFNVTKYSSQTSSFFIDLYTSVENQRTCILFHIFKTTQSSFFRIVKSRLIFHRSLNRLNESINPLHRQTALKHKTTLDNDVNADLILWNSFFIYLKQLFPLNDSLRPVKRKRPHARLENIDDC